MDISEGAAAIFRVSCQPMSDIEGLYAYLLRS